LAECCVRDSKSRKGKREEKESMPASLNEVRRVSKDAATRDKRKGRKERPRPSSAPTTSTTQQIEEGRGNSFRFNMA